MKKLILLIPAMVCFVRVIGQMAASSEIENFSKEKLVNEFSFYGTDSLSGYNFVKAYNTAIEAHGINTSRELRAFFHIDESAFVKKKYGIKEEPVPTRRIDSPNSASSITCNNLNFENGDFTGWVGACGYNTNSYGPITVTWPGIHNGNINDPTGACTYHTLINSAYIGDPFGQIPAVDPGGGNWCARLGGDQINLYEGYCNLPSQDWSYSAGESLEQTFAVTTSNALVTCHYAIVVQDAPHNYGEQPYFKIEVLDQSGNVQPCYLYYVEAMPATGGPPPGFFSSSIFGYAYLPWTVNTLDLAPYIGQQVTVRFSSAGCIYGGHSAHAYIDVECGASTNVISVIGNNINCTGSGIDSLIAPGYGGASYNWTGPGILGSYSNQAITVNRAGQYLLTIHLPTGCDYHYSVNVPGPDPTVQASNLTFTNVTSNSMTVNWTNGNGTRRIVRIKPTNSFTAPVNAVDYIPNPVYLGGEQTVYNGIGNSVTVTGLASHHMYWFRVYEANCSGNFSLYNTSTASGNPRQRITPPSSSQSPNRPESEDREETENMIKIFPNPTSGSFTIQCGMLNAELKISDIAGRMVYSQRVNQKSDIINQKLSPGIYFVELYDGIKYYTQKLVIE
jgi:hypothetical protein